MAEWQKDGRDPVLDQTDPNDPPNIDVQPVGSASSWVYLGPFIVMLVIVGVALLYWATRDGTPDDGRVEPGVGTSGEVTAGGGDPDSKPDNTLEERDSRQDAR